MNDQQVNNPTTGTQETTAWSPETGSAVSQAGEAIAAANPFPVEATATTIEPESTISELNTQSEIIQQAGPSFDNFISKANEMNTDLTDPIIQTVQPEMPSPVDNVALNSATAELGNIEVIPAEMSVESNTEEVATTNVPEESDLNLPEAIAYPEQDLEINPDNTQNLFERVKRTLEDIHQAGQELEQQGREIEEKFERIEREANQKHDDYMDQLHRKFKEVQDEIADRRKRLNQSVSEISRLATDEKKAS